MKVGGLLDQLIEACRYRFQQRQVRQRREDHLAVARRFALVAKTDRAVGAVKLCEHIIVAERIRVGAVVRAAWLHTNLDSRLFA
jgi:hypothetical protein